MKSNRLHWLFRAGLAVMLPWSLSMVSVAQAASPAASACPPMFFLSDNLAANADFEEADAGVPAGDWACWTNGDPVPAQSAAAGWLMHTSNDGAEVCSRLVPSNAPGPNGDWMVRFAAGGNEGGLFQEVAADPAKSYMFSIWVKVRRGQVAIQSNGTVGGPVAWSTKIGEWEQLRVCTNSLFSTNALIVYNQDPNGGDFLVDRVEVKEIPTLE